MRKLLLQHKLAVGDVLVMSGLVRDIALTYPNEFQVSVATSIPELWRHNPYVTPYTPSDSQQDVELIELGYSEAIRNVGNRNRHFLCGFYEDFKSKTQIHVPTLYPRPDYHLSDDEKYTPLVSGRYWVVISGGKNDFVTKHWYYKRYQQVVNILKQGGIHCVQVGAIGQGGTVYHFHPRLENTLCLVGLTTIRDMARLIYHAEGVICPVTAAMHFAAALQKPCVVIAGGREEWWWEGYVPGLGNFGTDLREDVKVGHRFLHTLGKLDCCKYRGCWKNSFDTESPLCCKYPLDMGQTVPACMAEITVNHVIEAIMSYYEDGTLPPIGTPKTIAVVDGRLRILAPNELIPSSQPSVLAAALTIPEPRLLIETEGLQQIAQKLNKCPT